MQWVPDRTGRFVQRPHYDPGELDDLCEAMVADFLQDKHGRVSYPIHTNDLTILIDREAQDLDLFADLSTEGEDVQGVTDFLPGERPRVRIARDLSEQQWRENRLRTTLTHELGHVVVHGPLYARALPQRSLFEESGERGPSSPRCKRDAMLPLSDKDWMEWQAGYVSGAFLIPRSAVSATVTGFIAEVGAACPLPATSVEGREINQRVEREFQVSSDAARVRLLQLAYLTSSGPSTPLF